MTTSLQHKSITVPQLIAKKSRGEKIVSATCYDATFAKLLDPYVDIVMIGDSLGMVIQGHENTLSVTLDDVLYHTRCVSRVSRQAHILADMPFMTYQANIDDALRNAGRLLKEGGAASVKMEGGESLAPLIARMTQIGIPVMAHIGLCPQSLHQMGGYKTQGRTRNAEAQLLADAKAVADAGAYAVVLEGITIEVAAAVTKAIAIPTIGIGSGPHCDGQVLVIYDLLGMNLDFQPRFLKQYATLADTITRATSQFAIEVRAGLFPTDAHALHQTPELQAVKQ